MATGTHKASREKIETFLAAVAKKRHPHVDLPRLRFRFRPRAGHIYSVNDTGRVVTVTFGLTPLHRTFLTTFDKAMRDAHEVLRGASRAHQISVARR